jgi:hypothetical protein
MSVASPSPSAALSHTMAPGMTQVPGTADMPGMPGVAH